MTYAHVYCGVSSHLVYELAARHDVASGVVSDTMVIILLSVMVQYIHSKDLLLLPALIHTQILPAQQAALSPAAPLFT
jgi:hypothetical protein